MIKYNVKVINFYHTINNVIYRVLKTDNPHKKRISLHKNTSVRLEKLCYSKKKDLKRGHNKAYERKVSDENTDYTIWRL